MNLLLAIYDAHQRKKLKRLIKLMQKESVYEVIENAGLHYHFMTKGAHRFHDQVAREVENRMNHLVKLVSSLPPDQPTNPLMAYKITYITTPENVESWMRFREKSGK